MRVCLSLFCPDEKLLVYPVAAAWEVPVCVLAPQEVRVGPTHTHFRFPVGEGAVSLHLGLLKPPG